MTEAPEGYIDATPILRRRMAWDVLPCDMVPEMITKLGLTPGTEDGDELEHQVSHDRLNGLIPIEGLLRVTIALAGDIIARAILDNAGEDNIGPSNMEYQQYVRAINAGVIGVMANLLDMDAIHLSGDAVIRI